MLLTHTKRCLRKHRTIYTFIKLHAIFHEHAQCLHSSEEGIFFFKREYRRTVHTFPWGRHSVKPKMMKTHTERNKDKKNNKNV